MFWAGTFQPRKNVRVLLDAFARLDGDDVPHRLVLAGPPGWKPDDADAVAARALGDRVRLLGPGRSAHDSSRCSRAPTCSRSRAGTRASGIPVLEAMAQGTAVVCSDIPALREVAGDAARFVGPDDLDGWIDAFRTLLDRRRRRVARSSRAGDERVAGYSWDRCAARDARRCTREALSG